MKCKRRSYRKKWVLVHKKDGKSFFFEGILNFPYADSCFLHSGRNIEGAYTFYRKSDARKCITYINTLYENGAFERIWHIDGKPNFQITAL